MAGRKQHYIPQALLRAFRFNPKGKAAQVYVFRSDRTYPSSVEGVAAERFFFSEPGETLDEVMTRHESGRFNDDLHELSNHPAGPVDCELVARMLAHLVLRTHHLRGIIQSGASGIADLVDELFGGYEQISRSLGADGPQPSPRFRKMFVQAKSEDAMLESLGLPEPVLESFAYTMLRENQQAVFPELADAVTHLAAAMRDQAQKMARNSHVQCLSTSMVPEGRAKMLRGLDWRLVDVDAITFILPDFVCLAFDHVGNAGTLFSFDESSLAAVLMPLSPTRMLIGDNMNDSWDLSTFNEQAAPHCLDFFVSAFTDEKLAGLAKTISSRVLEPIQGALADAAREFRTQIERPQETTFTAETGSWLATPLRALELHTDFLAANDAGRLSASLGKLLGFAHNRFDVSSLLEIDVAADYAGALSRLDRGSLAEREPITPSTEGLSAAFNVDVERNGELGVVMVLHADTARMLLSEEDMLFSCGASIVMAQLIRISADKLLRTVFSGGISVGKAHDRWLLGPATAAWRSYLISGYECMFSPDLGVLYRSQFLERLTALRESLVTARRTYRIEGSIDALLHTVIRDSADVLEAAATAAASLIHIPESPDVTDFKAQLEAGGWSRWFELLQADLADIWHERAPYPDQDAFLVLNRHLERLLFTGAIFLWTDSSVCRVEVPLWSDRDWILAQGTMKS